MKILALECYFFITFISCLFFQELKMEYVEFCLPIIFSTKGQVGLSEFPHLKVDSDLLLTTSICHAGKRDMNPITDSELWSSREVP